MRVVVAAVRPLGHRRAAELAAPDHERVDSSRPRRFRSVSSPAIGWSLCQAELAVVAFEVGVGVPAVGVAAVELHEAHAALDHPPGEQAAQAELGRLLAVEAVELLRLLGLRRDVDHLRGVGLHAEGQLVGGDAGGQFGVVAAAGEVLAVALGDEVERARAAARRRRPAGLAGAATGDVPAADDACPGTRPGRKPLPQAGAPPFGQPPGSGRTTNAGMFRFSVPRP